jgi:hypothetical protein
MIAGKLNDGLAPRSVRNIRAVRRRALTDAQVLGLVTRKAVAIIRAPKAERGEMQVYTPEQVGQLLEAAKTERLGALHRAGGHNRHACRSAHGASLPDRRAP